MLNEKALNKIEELVEVIYSPDQENLNEAVIHVLDAFSELIEKMMEMGYTIDMTEELTRIQNAYMKKDYAELADILLYDIKPGLLGISV